MNRKITHLERAGASLSIAIALIAPAAAHALGRRDLALGAAFFVVVVLMGLWGHVVVGAVIGGVAWLLGAGARRMAGKAGRGRGWSDWPSPAAARVGKQTGRRRPLLRGPARSLVPLFANPERTDDPELR